MRCAVMLCLLAFAGCRSTAKEPGPTHAEPPPPITATPSTASPPSPTPPPTTGTQAPPAMAPPFVTPPPGPTKPPAPAAAPGATTCQKDSDCTLTYVAEAGCCPTLCAPRGVTVAEARRREGLVQQCEQSRGHPCPVPACRARAFEAACAAGACTARPANTD